MKSFIAVTPCGGTLDEVRTTARSVARVAGEHPDISFEHHLVFNNGLIPQDLCTPAPSNYLPIITDLGAVASRAQARNSALDRVAERSHRSIICFMDAGDILLNEGSIDHAFARQDDVPAMSMWAFSARIVGANVSSTRKPRPLWTRKVGNPFFIGATFVSTDLALSTRFDEGAKEDWKYWLDLLDRHPHIELGKEIAYEYQVVSAADHLRRKRRLLRNQYDFFALHLGYGHGIRTVASMLAHVALAGGSWVRRLRPPRWPT